MRIFIIALAVLYWAGASLATSLVIKPANCPVAADLALLAVGDADADDLNAWRPSSDKIKPTVDIEVAESYRTDRIFTRFDADTKTGETLIRRENRCD